MAEKDNPFQRILDRHLSREHQQDIRRKTSIKCQSKKDYMQSQVDAYNNTPGILPDYDCKECLNKGLIYVVSENEDVYGNPSYEIRSYECKCKEIRNEIRRLKSSGLYRLAKRNTFNTFKISQSFQKEIKKKAQEYVKDFGDSWFYIGGQPGCGKTHLCTAIVTTLIKNGMNARYMVWTEDIPTLKQFINDKSFENLIKPYYTVDVLYIDDFLKTRQGEAISTADVNMAFKIINHRYNAGLISIISSELSLSNIFVIDEALAGRIAQMTGNDYDLFIEPDPSKDYRRQNK